MSELTFSSQESGVKVDEEDDASRLREKKTKALRIHQARTEHAAFSCQPRP
jgi:hypothetical protein